MLSIDMHVKTGELIFEQPSGVHPPQIQMWDAHPTASPDPIPGLAGEVQFFHDSGADASRCRGWRRSLVISMRPSESLKGAKNGP